MKKIEEVKESLKENVLNISTYIILNLIIYLVISLESLNQGMEWTADYFKKIRSALINVQEKKEITYSFRQSDEEGGAMNRTVNYRNLNN